MGADGGSIPRRCEMVRTAERKEISNSSTIITLNWTTCQLSKEPLLLPIVSCRLGRIYSKTSILELLIDKKRKSPSSSSYDLERFSHLNSLKDIQELKITCPFLEYICPVSNKPLNGINQFFFLWGCGCIFSESVLKSFTLTHQLCPVCSHKFSLENDIVFLNPLASIPAKKNYHPVTKASSLPLEQKKFHSFINEKVTSAKSISSISSIYSSSKGY